MAYNYNNLILRIYHSIPLSVLISLCLDAKTGPPYSSTKSDFKIGVKYITTYLQVRNSEAVAPRNSTENL